jgi:hypothetical protein
VSKEESYIRRKKMDFKKTWPLLIGGVVVLGAMRRRHMMRHFGERGDGGAGMCPGGRFRSKFGGRRGGRPGNQPQGETL